MVEGIQVSNHIVYLKI